MKLPKLSGSRFGVPSGPSSAIAHVRGAGVGLMMLLVLGFGAGAGHAQTPAAPAEAPKAEAPKAEAPKAEAPKAEAPKGEAPKGPPKLDLAKGQQIATQVCAACHGADGNSSSPANPKLAGQHADYLYKQLQNFKPKAGAKEAERANAIMAGFAATLSDADMRNVAAFYASQKLKPSSAKNKDIVELGQKIYRGGIASKNVAACAGCHSPNGAGIPAQYPRLAGQFAEYTEAQLVGFRQGTRKNSAQMTTIASRLSDPEMKAVSDYIAGMR